MEYSTEFLLRPVRGAQPLGSKKKEIPSRFVQQLLTEWLDQASLPTEVGGIKATPVLESSSSEIQDVPEGNISQERAYPHAFDQSSPEGMARASIANAANRMSLALDAFEDGDIFQVSSRLGEAAVSLSVAHQKLGRDNPLAALVGYMKRSLLVADVDALTRASIEAMNSVLLRCANSPIMRLTEAARQSGLLERNGWRGDEPAIAALAAAVLNQAASEDASTGQTAIVE